MPVYRQSKLIHIHIPKTGGTAISRFFHRIGDMEWNGSSLVGQKKMGNRWFEFQHLTMSELLDHTRDEFDQFRSFTVVRNPYSRLVSDFRWRCNIKKHRPNAKIHCFDSFMDFMKSIPVDIGTNWNAHMEVADNLTSNFLIHVRPQYQYIFSASNDQIVPEIMTFENLGPEFGQLCKQIGQTNTIVMSGNDISYIDYYDEQTIEIVNRLYTRDFELGSYEML